MPNLSPRLLRRGFTVAMSCALLGGPAVQVVLAAGGAPVASWQDDEREVVETWPDGSVRLRYTVDEEGRKDGAFEEFREDGALWRKGSYREDQLSGTYSTFYPGGEKHVVAQYRAGQKHGVYREYRADGKKIEISRWRSGELHGRFESFHEGGSRDVVADYRAGQLHGKHKQTREDGRWERTSSYESGSLHGEVKIVEDRKTLSKQKWVGGELEMLDGRRPFPVRLADLRASLAQTLAPPAAPIDVSTDPLAEDRAAALRLLQTYRELCRVPHEEMALNPEWFEMVDLAAEVCRRNGGLSHDPPRPADMDQESYTKGHRGAKSSNLSMGSGMVGSVDDYMDDSDPSNIARLGHRRWCLNPHMRRTAFGEAGRYSAMWSFDASGAGAKGIDTVKYPPEGWVPVNFFGARYAWSVATLRGVRMVEEKVEVEIVPLDQYYLAAGEPLEIDFMLVSGPGYGAGACLIFQPAGLRVTPGARYRCRITQDSGKTWVYDYVVEFCEPIRSGG